MPEPTTIALIAVGALAAAGTGSSIGLATRKPPEPPTVKKDRNVLEARQRRAALERGRTNVQSSILGGAPGAPQGTTQSPTLLGN